MVIIFFMFTDKKFYWQWIADGLLLVIGLCVLRLEERVIKHPDDIQ